MVGDYEHLDVYAGQERRSIPVRDGWAKGEARRQTRQTALLGSLAVVAALAALGANTIGLIALYFWLSVQLGQFPALGIIASGLLDPALIPIGLSSRSSSIALPHGRGCKSRSPRP